MVEDMAGGVVGEVAVGVVEVWLRQSWLME
jgi:hypothetical protein